MVTAPPDYSQRSVGGAGDQAQEIAFVRYVSASRLPLKIYCRAFANVVMLLQHNKRGMIMTITTLSSREFNQDASGAKKAAASGPVFITDRGRPAHVLLTIEEYQRVTRSQTSIVDLLAMPGVADIDFTPPRLSNDLYRPADLS